MKITELSYPDIEKLYTRQGYKFYIREYSVNLFAIRSLNYKDNEKFNDTLGIAVKNKEKDVLFLFPGTVDPGIPWLIHPMNGLCTAAIVPGQYPGVWQYGYFKGTEALIQVGNFQLYRDYNHDTTFDYNPDTIVNSPYTDGIFFHEHFQGVDEAISVGRSSAGCVVPKRNSDKQKGFEYIRNQFNAGMSNRFTFTLLNEADVLTL